MFLPSYYSPRAGGWIIGLVTSTFIRPYLLWGLGMSAHLVSLSPPLLSDDHKGTSMKMKAIAVKIAGCTGRKHLKCASELTSSGTALPLDFLLCEMINSFYCSVHFWLCILYFWPKRSLL